MKYEKFYIKKIKKLYDKGTIDIVGFGYLATRAGKIESLKNTRHGVVVKFNDYHRPIVLKNGVIAVIPAGLTAENSSYLVNI